MKLRPFFRQAQGLPRWLLAGFVTAVGLLLALGAVAYFNVERQVEATGLVEHTYEVAVSLQRIRSVVQEADNNQRTYLVSGADGSLQAYKASGKALPGLLDATAALIADSPAQGMRLTVLRGLITERLLLADQRVAQRQELGAEALAPRFISPAGAQLMEAIRTGTDAMTGSENTLLEKRLHLLERARRRGLSLQTVGGALSLALLLAVFGGLVTQILRTRRAEEDERRTNAQLEDANKEMRSFSYSVAHDLRAPLRAINGFAQVLVEDCDGQLNEDGRRALGRITTNARTMGVLIDDLLTLSKVSYQPLQSGRVEMTDIVRSAYQALTEGQDGRVVECQIGELPPAAGDPNLLRQVWMNLIANALKFTRRRDRAHIEIGGNVAGPEFATYFIRDNGAGFDMQYVDKLFGAFQRLHPATEFEGTGIGLALVQRIIHRHGGTIWAEGRENDGAMFAFTLPEWEEPA